MTAAVAAMAADSKDLDIKSYPLHFAHMDQRRKTKKVKRSALGHRASMTAAVSAAAADSVGLAGLALTSSSARAPAPCRAAR